MTHNIRHPWSKAHGLRSEFLIPILIPLKELQNLTHMDDISNNTYSDIHVSPLSSLREPTGGYESLIPYFTHITISCPNSTNLMPLV